MLLLGRQRLDLGTDCGRSEPSQTFGETDKQLVRRSSAVGRGSMDSIACRRSGIPFNRCDCATGLQRDPSLPAVTDFEQLVSVRIPILSWPGIGFRFVSIR